jgi:hypothetical protein
MTRWLRALWPPIFAIVFFLAMIAAERLFIFSLAIKIDHLTDEQSRELYGTFPPVTLLAGAIFYAFYRVFAFSPAFQADYRDWLMQTPWRFPQQLPFGPVHLVVQDVLLVGFFAVAGVPFYGTTALLAVKLFVWVYLLALTFHLGATREWPATYALGIALGGLVLVWSTHWQFIILAAITYGVAYVGLGRSLERFPWTFDIRAFTGVLPRPGQYPRQETRSQVLGPPFDQLAPSVDTFRLTLPHGIVRSLLLGWWVFLILNRIEWALLHQKNPEELNSLTPTYILTGFLLVGRLIAYEPFRYLSPISLAGRFATGRWIIPAYDRVFLAPALMVAAVCLVPRVLIGAGIGYPLVNALTSSIVASIALTAGPSVRRWILTGGHRIAMGNFGLAPKEFV